MGLALIMGLKKLRLLTGLAAGLGLVLRLEGLVGLVETNSVSLSSFAQQ